LPLFADLPGQWIDKVHHRRPPKRIVLDMDSSESPTYGDQEGSAYNGHFGCTCYHRLFVFNQLGDVERCVLRSGNVHSADGWRPVLEPGSVPSKPLCRLYAGGGHDLLLPEPVRNAILGRENAGIRRMSVDNSARQRRWHE
jgi:hypothetical protein